MVQPLNEDHLRSINLLTFVRNEEAGSKSPKRNTTPECPKATKDFLFGFVFLFLYLFNW